MERELKKAAMVVVWMRILEAISYIQLHKVSVILSKGFLINLRI
jgi:hypothetical protein